MNTVRSVGDNTIAIGGGENGGIVYSLCEKRILASFESTADTGSRFAVDLKRDVAVVGGWKSPLACFSVQTGRLRWRNKELCRMDDVSIHPVEALVLVSGINTKPNRGLVVCDLYSGQIRERDPRERMPYRRLVHPTGRWVIDQCARDEARVRWTATESGGRTFEFLGPAEFLAFAFSKYTLILGGVDRKLTLVNLSGQICREDLLHRNDLFGPFCYIASEDCFRVVVRLRDVLESHVLEISSDGGFMRDRCIIGRNVTGVFFENGDKICCDSGEIYDARSGELVDTLEFPRLLASKRGSEENPEE